MKPHRKNHTPPRERTFAQEAALVFIFAVCLVGLGVIAILQGY
jgi:hypothetical protein